VFDTQKNEARITLVEQHKGQSGFLTLQKLSVDSFEKQEYLLFSATTDMGQSLDQETCEKLFETVATSEVDEVRMDASITQRLQAESKRHAEATVAQALETSNKHFIEARDRLDRWADDMVLGAEQALKNTKEQIKVAQREARQAPTLDEQQALQEKIAKLERLQRKQRQEIFQIEDDIHDKRDQLITQLTERMAQKVDSQHLFTIEWQVK
jgi:predicted  nucleic acid-binding Zn-ribbon protein